MKQIFVSNLRVIGSWGDKPLYMGHLKGHPVKMDGEWPFSRVVEKEGKKYLDIRTVMNEEDLYQLVEGKNETP